MFQVNSKNIEFEIHKNWKLTVITIIVNLKHIFVDQLS